MDVLKDATVAGQTGIMDTGVNTKKIKRPITTSTGLKTGICSVCGRTVSEVIPVLTPDFCGKSISLQDDFSLNFYVQKAAFADGAYQNPYVVFQMEGQQTTITAYTQQDDYCVFSYEDITPDKMGQTVTAELYADKSDGTTFTASTSYSVAQYCYAALTLAADMHLNHPTAAALRSQWGIAD